VPAWLAKAAVTHPAPVTVVAMWPSWPLHELALALATVDFAVTNSQAALIAIDGEGGVGKSRLVDELIELARAAVGAGAGGLGGPLR